MVVAAVVGTVAAAGLGAVSANKAAKAQNNATAAAASSAQNELDLSKEQWDYNKNVVMPHQMANDDANMALQTKVANADLENSADAKSMSDTAFAQAQKSYKYQDQYMGMVDDYTSGKTANTMADEANADVNQAYSNSEGDMARGAARYGINPGSGAFAGGMGDIYNNKALAGAGAQTQARRQARDKAEQMVGIAAGSGAAGFGTGLNAAGLATGALGGASAASTAGVNGSATAAGTVNNGLSAAGSGAFGANRSWLGAAGSYNGSNPWAAGATGLLTSGIKAGAASGMGSVASYIPGTQSYANANAQPVDNMYGNGDNFDSDIALKENIRFIGKTERGYNKYQWDWKDGTGHAEGVLAQEVALRDPSAVSIGPRGFLQVDYSKV